MADQQQPDEDRLVELYQAAENALLSGIAGILANTTDWFRQIGPMRRLVREILDPLNVQTGPLIAGAIRASRATGDTAALAGIKDAGKEPFDFTRTLGQHAEQLLRVDLTSKLADVRKRITRLPDDVHKALTAQRVVDLLHDRGYTPEQVQAQLWRDFTSQGITGFTDKGGRNWSLSAYVEMAVRTVAARAEVEAHIERLTQQGVELFVVPPHATSCPLCFPWQGKVLSVKPDPRADATIDEARAAGLFHPNCRHTLGPYFPGITKRPVVHEYTEAHRQLYEDTQKQRALERSVREAKRDAAHALTPETAAEARGDVRDAQRRLKEFVDARPHLSRDSRREQLDLRDDRMPVESAKPPREPVAQLRNADGSTRRARPGAVHVPAGLTDPPKPHEVVTANKLAAAGHSVEFIRPSNEKGVRNADLWLDGVPFEMKSPTGSGRHTISNQLARASEQSDRLVLDTSRTPLPDDQIIAEVRRRIATSEKFTEVTILTKTGAIVRITR